MHERRSPAREGIVDEGRFVRTRQPRIGPQRVEAEARRRLQRPVARIMLKEERARSAGDVDGVLMQCGSRSFDVVLWASSDVNGAVPFRYCLFPGRKAGTRQSPGT
jgi:hypothetical protein